MICGSCLPSAYAAFRGRPEKLVLRSVTRRPRPRCAIRIPGQPRIIRVMRNVVHGTGLWPMGRVLHSRCDVRVPRGRRAGSAVPGVDAGSGLPGTALAFEAHGLSSISDPRPRSLAPACGRRPVPRGLEVRPLNHGSQIRRCGARDAASAQASAMPIPTTSGPPGETCSATRRPLLPSVGYGGGVCRSSLL